VSVNRHIEDAVAFFGPGIVFIPHPSRFSPTDRIIPAMTCFKDACGALTGRNSGLIKRKNEFCTSIDGIFDAGYA
jgi:hypothetical protein